MQCHQYIADSATGMVRQCKREAAYYVATSDKHGVCAQHARQYDRRPIPGTTAYRNHNVGV